MPNSINFAYEQRNETECIRMEMAGSVWSERLNTKIKVSNSTNYTVWCMQATTKAYHLLVNDRRQCKSRANITKIAQWKCKRNTKCECTENAIDRNESITEIDTFGILESAKLHASNLTAIAWSIMIAPPLPPPPPPPNVTIKLAASIT